MADFDELRRLAAEATPGPWVARHDADEGGYAGSGIYASSTWVCEQVGGETADREFGNAEYITALHNSVPALLAEIDRLRARTDWRPIATAPKDGTWFLVGRAGEGPETYEVGRWEPLLWPEYEQVEGDLYRRVDRPAFEWRGFNNFHRMTHWQPLPPPPQTGE